MAAITFTKSDLANKVAFITGGARGIGKAMCEALLQEKVKVCIADILEKEGNATVTEFGAKYGKGNIIFLKLNVVEEKEFEDVFVKAKTHFGHLDILCNNAGIANEANPKRTIEINLIGVVNGIQVGMKHLSNSKGVKGGTIINTASILGIEYSYVLPVYTATKHAVAALTRTWGNPACVKLTNVKVSAVCPDPTDTMIWDNIVSDKHVELMKQTELLKPHFLKSVDIANALMKVLHDDVSGALIVASILKGTYYHTLEDKDYIEYLIESGLLSGQKTTC